MKVPNNDQDFVDEDNYILSTGSYLLGVLISALSFDLMDEAYKPGRFDSTATDFISGAIAYTAANIFFQKKEARHRKRSGKKQPSEEENKEAD